jgi:hypothetical protein
MDAMQKPDDQQSMFTCPDCDRSFLCSTPGDRVEVLLHRALHMPDRSDRLGYLRLLGHQDHRPYSFR